MVLSMNALTILRMQSLVNAWILSFHRTNPNHVSITAMPVSHVDSRRIGRKAVGNCVEPMGDVGADYSCHDLLSPHWYPSPHATLRHLPQYYPSLCP
jgi:hypothetical protein